MRLRLAAAVDESEKQLSVGMRLLEQQKETARQAELLAEHEAVVMTALRTVVEYDLDEDEEGADEQGEEGTRETAPGGAGKHEAADQDSDRAMEVSGAQQ